MRYSNFFVPTLRDDPAEAEVISHKLMVRAGMIRKLASGIYSYLPLGLRSLRKVENIVREEMNRAGAIEMLMPGVQPAEIWMESGRWSEYGKELLRFKDRHDHEFCLGPTHEEVITDIARREIRSYRDMPVNLYHIQTKFRDEIRPRFGLMRCREFIMKDAYSFDVDEKSADISYWKMFEAYRQIFIRCGLRFTAVEADSGTIGGSFSHEFMVLAATGEDAIVNCPSCGYAANTEKAEVKFAAEVASPSADTPAYGKVLTPAMKTVESVTAFLKVQARDLIKTMIFNTEDGPVAVLVSGDREANPIKLKNLLGGVEPELADPAIIEQVTGAPVGFAGPVGLKIKLLADNRIKSMTRAVVGANEADHHLVDVVPGRDFTVDGYHDLTAAQPGDPCPKCGAELEFARGIEVGHVFKLGTKYSKKMQATYVDAEGKERLIIMGCYGIGPGRTMAAAIEQNHDEDGIIWPVPIAPFEAIVLPLQVHDQAVLAAAEQLYQALEAAGVETLLDDRDERPGIKFKDADLIGIPLRLSVSRKTLAQNQVEFKDRVRKEIQMFNLADAAGIIKEMRDQRKR
ncbi:MAG: proline--tRNA ligase [Deltaproteobacteria bacterium]|nr:proline--tRNA ligase [Deltaproteobacteria bacterium]